MLICEPRQRNEETERQTLCTRHRSRSAFSALTARCFPDVTFPRPPSHFHDSVSLPLLTVFPHPRSAVARTRTLVSRSAMANSCLLPAQQGAQSRPVQLDRFSKEPQRSWIGSHSPISESGEIPRRRAGGVGRQTIAVRSASTDHEPMRANKVESPDNPARGTLILLLDLQTNVHIQARIWPREPSSPLPAATDTEVAYPSRS